ncbi:hypothetical protein J437_LFUL012891 [Ladona fulva]|uniref:Uncharacterized protein n=1 Tax=Ladona fulva TaxID=123851 RepID=A0A8K0KEF9_LADFU|nr:hypothetical protein J437_LFUL012891 [Ladona fulva]
MSSASASDVYYRPGVNCIVTSVKSAKEINLRFVLEKKQYTVTYLEKKKNFDSRNLSQLLKGSEAVKASMWNVPFGPPGSNKRTWYVTDIWTPHIKDMKKNRIPEPTISIVCRITYNLGKEYIVCELGKNFCRDWIVLPRALIYSAPAVGKDDVEIGDYLLVTALILSETIGDEQKLRLTPIWAHWDRNNKALQSVIHLNIVESGSGKSTLIVQDQIPCMWGVVQAVFKKSMKVYVPALSLSISVQYSAVYQYDDSSSVKEGDWLQLWLTPKASQPNAHLSEITTWVCFSCCIRSKRDYNNYLHLRLKSNGLKEESSENAESAKKNVPEPAALARKAPSSDGAGDQQEVVVGLAKVHQVKEKSGTVRINSTEYVFHLGIMTVYGIKMSKIKNVKIKDLVDVGSEIRFKLNAKSDGLKSVWIGPEVVSFKHLNFMPQLMQWMKVRNLDTGLVKEMMKEITENFDAVNKNKETEPPKATKAKKEKSSKEGKLSSCSSHASQTSLVSEGGSSVDCELMLTMKNINLNAENVDFISFPDEVGSCSSYTKEEVEELEKLWWSEDSDESDDELRPIMRPTAPPNASGDNADGLQEQISCQPAVSEKVKGKLPFPAETEKPEPAELKSLEEKVQTSSELASGEGSSSSAPLGAEGFTKTVEDSKLGKTETEKASVQKQDKEDDAKPVTRTKHKDSSAPPSLLIMMELTKFLIEKGKAKSIPEAGELSAEFVALLEDALNKSPNVDTVTSADVGTQTEITGPVISVNVRLEDEENLSRLCSNEGIGNSLSLVD